jgi:hypothetical protein
MCLRLKRIFPSQRVRKVSVPTGAVCLSERLGGPDETLEKAKESQKAEFYRQPTEIDSIDEKIGWRQKIWMCLPDFNHVTQNQLSASWSRQQNFLTKKFNLHFNAQHYHFSSLFDSRRSWKASSDRKFDNATPINIPIVLQNLSKAL